MTGELPTLEVVASLVPFGDRWRVRVVGSVSGGTVVSKVLPGSFDDREKATKAAEYACKLTVEKVLENSIVLRALRASGNLTPKVTVH